MLLTITSLFSSYDYCPALVERKREEATRQQEADLKRKKVMELEEALRDGCKNRGVPREVRRFTSYHTIVMGQRVSITVPWNGMYTLGFG